MTQTTVVHDGAAFSNIKACVFDAYGTLFDVHSAVGRYREQLGDVADAVSATWRTKQLEYSWLRSLMNQYCDFWQVTDQALDYALDTHNVNVAGIKDQLMQAYLSLDTFEEVVGVLEQLKSAGFKLTILSNGSPAMLKSAVDRAGIAELMDVNLSVDDIGVFKPDPRVYELAVKHLGVKSSEISFQSSNAWDVAGASAYGFSVAWINRYGQKPERLPAGPHAELKTLHGLPDVVGRA